MLITVIGVFLGILLGILSVGFFAFGGANTSDWLVNGMVGGITLGLLGFAISIVKKITKNKNGPIRRMSIFFVCIICPYPFFIFAYYFTGIVVYGILKMK